MMKLDIIIENYKFLDWVGPKDLSISNLEIDSRKVEKGGLFFAIKGTQADGHLFIDKAIQNGAFAIVCEVFPNVLLESIAYIKVKNAADAASHLSHTFFGKPSLKTEVIGITGTNGKTTSVTMLYDFFTELGEKTALISTVQNIIGKEVIPSTHTTPDAINLNKLLAKAVQENCTKVFMEVSSHGIHQNRMSGIYFKIAGFTNITHDHLDYHKTFAEYLKTKQSFFSSLPKEAIAIYNTDDKNGKVMVQNTKAKILSYGLRSVADYKTKIIESRIDGTLIHLNGTEFWFPIAGNYNVYNATLVYAIAENLGIEKDIIYTTLSKAKNINGRYETSVSETNIYTIIDYAHTPDALENILESINKIRREGQNLITVFGCGGNRDKEKRPVMGKIAANLSTHVVLTSDNPRDEEPTVIIEDIEKGISEENYSKTTSIVNRKEAIKAAIQMAKSYDIILIAGKGHEKTQEIAGVFYEFDDKKITQEILKKIKK